MAEVLLDVKDLKMHFPVHGGILHREIAKVFAVDGVSFQLKAGETLGIVGESGCGKTTVGRTILRLYKPTAGEVHFHGQDLAHMRGSKLFEMRKKVQMIFQDPFGSLNARHSVGHIIEEPLIIHKVGNAKSRKAEVERLLDRVGLPRTAIKKYPHEFSGGQRQRIGIARAVALNPELIVCDEPVSALDVSIQSQVLNLLLELQEELGLSYIFIAHDLAVVKHISDRIAVMYLGKIVEMADAEEIYHSPKHPYTKALISAIPQPDPERRSEREILAGEVPSPMNPPSGCRFHTRCPVATAECRQKEPELKKTATGDADVACHLVK